MLNRVKGFIEKHKLIKPGELLILAVSGGPDSMALLHIMKELQSDMQISLAAAHLNHGLRAEAGAEEELAGNYCSRWGIPFYSQTVDVRNLAQEEKKSLEEAGRNCRYAFFQKLQIKLAADKIATAHHQDDMAETVLLHLLRGSGIKGLRGIMPLQSNLIRPLLAVSKADILSYLEANNIAYAVDQSNSDLSFLRNRIRYQLIPELRQEYNPRIVEALNRLGETAREDNDALEIATRRCWDSLIIKNNPDCIIMNKSSLLKLHPAYQSRIIREALFQLKGEAGWDSQDILSIKNLALKPGSSKNIRLKNAVTVKAVYEELQFCLQIPLEISFNYELSIPGLISIPEIGASYMFKIEDAEQYRTDHCLEDYISLRAAARIDENNGQYPIQNSKLKIHNFTDICLDFDKLGKPLFIRSRQKGDRIYPIGIKGSKKIKDYFIDIKLPLSERNKVPLLAANDSIYALLGLKISRLAAVSAATRRILRISKTKE